MLFPIDSGGVCPVVMATGPSGVAFCNHSKKKNREIMRNPIYQTAEQSLLNRASKYLSRLLPSIQGQRGNDKLFTAATVLAHGFAIEEEQSVQILLTEFNHSCQPPWQDAEIRRAVRDAIKKEHKMPRGRLARSQNWSHMPSSPANNFVELRLPRRAHQAPTAFATPDTTIQDFGPEKLEILACFDRETRFDELIAAHFGIPSIAVRTLGCIGLKPTASGGIDEDFSGSIYWPEEDGSGKTIGICSRVFSTGQKLANKGSKRGLTFPPGWEGRQGRLFVAEGFSDMLALHAAGLNAVCRPSKSFSALKVATYLSNALGDSSDKEVVILADQDDAVETGNAAQIANELKRLLPKITVSWAKLPNDVKDVRALLTDADFAGKTWEDRGKLFEEEMLTEIKSRDLEVNSPSGTEPVPLGILMATYPELRPVIIGDLLREGETMNVIAAPKTGKSWLVCDLALAISTGHHWLGKFTTRKGKVLVLDNELHPETSAVRFRMVSSARGISQEEFADEIQLSSLRGNLRPLVEMDDFFSKIEPGKFQIIILDAMYRFQAPDASENDNAAMTQLYNTIDRYALRLKCGFVLVHHTSKGGQGEKSVVDVGSGAGSQSRAADTHLVLRPHEDDSSVVLDACNRSFAPVQSVGLRFSFPVWNVDETLDVTKLKLPYRQGKRQTAKEDPSVSVDDDRPKWDSEYLGQQIESYGTTGIGRESFTNLVAKGACVSPSRAERMIRMASEPNVNTIQKRQNGRNTPAMYVATRLLNSVVSSALALDVSSDNVIPETFKQNKE